MLCSSAVLLDDVTRQRTDSGDGNDAWCDSFSEWTANDAHRAIVEYRLATWDCLLCSSRIFSLSSLSRSRAPVGLKVCLLD